MRKALRSEQLKAELNKKTKEVEMTKLDLTRRVEELKQFCEDTAEGFKENQSALEKKNSDVPTIHYSLFVCASHSPLACTFCSRSIRCGCS